jgi:hypothetical protein
LLRCTVTMDEDNSSIPATPKLGIRVSDDVLSPVRPVEPDFSVRPDAGSHPEVADNRQSEITRKMSAPEEGNAPKLPWAPTKEDLLRLYIDQRLSVRKIGKLYDHETPNPRSMDFEITYYLKKYGITRRNRIQELHKATDKVAAEWVAKHPKTEPFDIKVEEEAVLELLRNGGLSINRLDADIRGRVKVVMEFLYFERGLSFTDIAPPIGKTSGTVSRIFEMLGIKPRPREEARRKGIIEKHRKHERKPFDGTDEDKAYILGVAHGDFHVSRPFGDAVRISTSTTHPAMVELFESLFSRYGHVDRYPRYKKDTGTYGWNIQVILDKSFEFLLEPRDKCREWVMRKGSTMLAYLAGLIDAEGHIRPHANPKTVGIDVSIWNTDTELLDFAYNCLKHLGYRPLEPYLSQPPGGESSGFHIARRKAEWRVLLARFEETQSLLRRLPLQHREKVAKKEVALSVAQGDLYDGIAEKVSSLRKSIKEETEWFTKLAELEYLRTHPGKNPRIEHSVKESGDGDDRKTDVAPRERSGLVSGEDANRRRKSSLKFGGAVDGVFVSPAVLCVLQKDVKARGLRQTRRERGDYIGVTVACHDRDACFYSLLGKDEPCVVIWKGCDARNIVQVLVHESIHHSLFWLDQELKDDDRFDRICETLQRQRRLGF